MPPRLRLPVAIFVLACLSNSTGTLFAQPPIAFSDSTRIQLREALRNQYLQLKREQTSRQFLKSFRVPPTGRELEFLQKVYRVRRDPMLAQMSDRELDLHIREIGGRISSEAMTYGGEDVMDIYWFTPTVVDPNHPFVTDPSVLSASASVVAIVYRSSLMKNSAGKWELTTGPLDKVLGGSENLCVSDRYHGSPSAHVAGTGFLIGPDLIATAGHVVSQPGTDFLNSVYFLFGYTMDTQDAARTLYIDDEVYTGTQVLADYNDDLTDWALIRLNRAVVGRTPLPYRTAGKVPGDARLYMLGHPNGMPLKYTGPAKITENTACSRFLTDLDTHPYNSGSPVFNLADQVVEGILVSDIGNFEAFCDCMAGATYAPAMGIPGAGVTRILDVAEYLARPGTVVVQCQVPSAHVTSGGVATAFDENETAEVPYTDIGMDLFVNVDCSLHYRPCPGQTWVIKLAQSGGGVFMQRSCPE